MKNKLFCKSCDDNKKGKSKTSFKTIFAGLVALVACPCHLVIFIPLLAGTAFGSVLAQYTGILTAILAVIFGLSIWYLIKNLNTSEKKQ
jgi:mercuric ion transport protein